MGECRKSQTDHERFLAVGPKLGAVLGSDEGVLSENSVGEIREDHIKRLQADDPESQGILVDLKFAHPPGVGRGKGGEKRAVRSPGHFQKLEVLRLQEGSVFPEKTRFSCHARLLAR